MNVTLEDGTGLSVDGRQLRLGLFATPEDAAAAYDAAVVGWRGEFGVTNAELLST